MGDGMKDEEWADEEIEFQTPDKCKRCDGWFWNTVNAESICPSCLNPPRRRGAADLEQGTSDEAS